MKNTISLLFLVVFFITSAIGQNISISNPDSYKEFVDALDASKNIKYQEVLDKYESYIESNPNDISAKIARCKFIGLAFYDEYEDYDTNWEETENCIDQLYEKYNTHPKVLIYKAENLYGDERLEVLKSSISTYYSNTQVWADNTKARLFELAAYAYKEEDYDLALDYADKAERFNKEIDLSSLNAEIHISNGDIDKAKDALEVNLQYESEVWELNNKGNLLIEVEEFDKALEVFERVKEKDSSYVNNTNLYTILINKEKPGLARKYLVEDTIVEWNKIEKLQNLFNHDLEYSDGPLALASYKRLQEESFYDDFFGIKRIKLFLKSPLLSISATDVAHYFLLVLLILILFLIPYIWVLPVYSLGKYFKLNKNYPSLWNLKHFWLISFIYLFIQTLLVFVFYYQDYMNYIFDVTGSYYVEEEEIITPGETIFFIISLFIGTIIFLNRERLKFVFKSKWTLIEMVVMGGVFFIFNIILIFFLKSFIDFPEISSYVSPLSIREEIILLMNEKGFLITFLLVAIIVPFYEEIIFRGIILSSSMRHIGFIKANILQASLFGLVHFNLGLFPFYFVFGLVTGWVAKKNEGLISNIVFHSIHNGIIVMLMYFYSSFM